jgi:hypothetical protein
MPPGNSSSVSVATNPRSCSDIPLRAVNFQCQRPLTSHFVEQYARYRHLPRSPGPIDSGRFSSSTLQTDEQSSDCSCATMPRWLAEFPFRCTRRRIRFLWLRRLFGATRTARYTSGTGRSLGQQRPACRRSRISPTQLVCFANSGLRRAVPGGNRYASARLPVGPLSPSEQRGEFRVMAGQ